MVMELSFFLASHFAHSLLLTSTEAPQTARASMMN
jgi:hypothetical protein